MPIVYHQSRPLVHLPRILFTQWYVSNSSGVETTMFAKRWDKENTFIPWSYELLFPAGYTCILWSSRFQGPSLNFFRYFLRSFCPCLAMWVHIDCHLKTLHLLVFLTPCRLIITWSVVLLIYKIHSSLLQIIPLTIKWRISTMIVTITKGLWWQLALPYAAFTTTDPQLNFTFHWI